MVHILHNYVLEWFKITVYGWNFGYGRISVTADLRLSLSDFLLLRCFGKNSLSVTHYLYNYIRARYGHPDMQFLGTLKLKFEIFRFLTFLSKNMVSNLIFRGAIYLLPLKPWKKYIFKISKKHFNCQLLVQLCRST